MSGIQYRPDIDGLRAIAVLAVVLYHFGLGGLSGGFVGVDVFFVISGYLITGIIHREMQRGEFTLVRFYERRARRIFPALFGFPSLVTGSHDLAIAIATITAALAAIGFGMIIGTAATTHGQAAMFGSVIVVLLGVISGTFLPVHLMPESIRLISMASPLRWGIENYLDLFVRDSALITILPRSLLLVGFFGLAIFISILIFAKRK